MAVQHVRATGPLFRVLGLALFTGAAYYAGAAVGLALKLPDATPSVMWPPNAILTSLLLLTRREWWPVVLLSALPPHVALESGAGWHIALILALFVTNCSEALIAAAGLRWLSDAPTRFDSMRRITVFVAVVVISAPFLSSFLDAAVVSSIGGEPYWGVWRSRLFANSLTALTVVPTFVMIGTSALTWRRSAPRYRQIEAVLLALAILIVGSILFRPPAAQDPMATALVEGATLAWFLPFLLWAALRFGPCGASVALLATALFLVGAAVHSHGPFRGLSPADTTLALQLFLITMSLPLLVAAALVEERRLAQDDTSRRLSLEALLAHLARRFVHLPSNRMPAVFRESLQQVGEFLGLDGLMLLECSESTRDMTPAAAWTAAGSEHVPGILFRLDLLWPVERLRRNEFVKLGDVAVAVAADNGGDALTDHERAVAVPLIAEERMLGVLAFTSGTWPSDLLPRMQSIARVLATALFRKQSEGALRASETMKTAILASLLNGVVVVDRHGRIISANDHWRPIAGGDAPPNTTEVGGDYLESYRATARSGTRWAGEVAAGIEAVLLGTSRHFQIEHSSPGPDGDCMILIRAVPLNRSEGGAVITHTDVSSQRRAELEARRARAELAHVSRVSTVGMLTASIAHQLNQPLTGILANAQAARRLLEAAPPDLDEALASLADIVEDERRAGDVIVRMRDLLRKDEGPVAEIDLNTLVADVAQLLSSDAIIRNVVMSLELDPVPALVRGDRVQLQQVVLNLVVNALEAVADRPRGHRRVMVGSKCTQNFVKISVVDSGVGFNVSADLPFEAFYTTKPGGIGLGLSISKSIVEAHGGMIYAAANLDAGATVCFSLPLVHHGSR